MSTTKKPHIHAALMLEYAKDAAESETPWEGWQCFLASWAALNDHPAWCVTGQYRRTPKTIRIGAFDVPEPLRELPAKYGDLVWMPALMPTSVSTQIRWDAFNPLHLDLLKQGLLHATKENARIHGEALISLTAQEAA